MGSWECPLKYRMPMQDLIIVNPKVYLYIKTIGILKDRKNSPSFPEGEAPARG